MSDPLDVFSPPTRRWFREGFAAPTEVQAQAWPAIAQGRHTLMVAPTGSGKTLAAFLYGIDRVLRLPPDAPKGVRVLYVSPLKALVYDIERNLRAPLVGIGHAAARAGDALRDVRVDLRTGDTPPRDRARQKRNPGEILVTTPESLYLLLTSAARDTLRTVQTVILDEIHVLSGTKRGVHLALSLERLSALCDEEPQRLGLSATQRPLEVAARFLGGDRPVHVVDTSEPPRLELDIVVPVADMENPPSAPRPEAHADPEDEGAPWDDDWTFGDTGGANPPHTGNTSALSSGIWPSIHPKLVEAIRAHRSTILFVNSRILCERLTQALNDTAGETLVHAHHGSISHEQRARIEDALKAGRIPGIVATSSLELGIDMGAVDLVILVESPGSTASGLQRIGRAGHQVGATSRGLIFPKYRGDLLEAAVVSRRMQEGAIEATRMPERCLDVLAQQVAAMVAMEAWSVEDLLGRVTRAAPYASLTRPLLEGVLDMLSGRYPSDAFADLTPVITWDRAHDTLEPRRGTQLTAVLNGGTIPDRGLYRVHLVGDGPRLGELDEEMVYESREGDTIILGASTWRIEEITRDRVNVSPAPGQPGRLPFWRGERPGRPLELGRSLGAFLRELPNDVEQAEAHLVATTPLDPLAARNLVAYVQDQRDATGSLPTDRAITVERFRDELGDWRVCILTPFGSRVHAPWALALQGQLSARAGFDVTAFWTDDGVALRFVDGERIPDVDDLLPHPDDIEDLVVGELRHSALFATRFREAAGRALLLPRKRGRQRTPLWLQRKKSSDLLAVAQQYSSFPIVLEAYRECLRDVFDVPALQELLGAIQAREVRVDEVETRSASPFARSLVFQYVGAYLYDGDAPLAERKAQALALDRNLLRELLGQAELRDLLDADAVQRVELSLQHLSDERRARHADALHDLLRRLGDLTPTELAARATEDPGPWLQQLLEQRRAVAVRIAGEERWIAADDAGRYRDALGVALPPGIPQPFLAPTDAPLEGLLRRWARTHGPFLTEPLAQRWGLPAGAVDAVLVALEREGELTRGEFRPGGLHREWCDPEVLRRLRRTSLAALRQEIEPVDDGVYARFLPDWHGVGRERGGMARLQDVIDQLEGAPLPFRALESDILPSRVPAYQPMLLDQLGAMGEIVWIGRGALGTKDGRIALYRRERVGLLADPPSLDDLPDHALHRTLLDHLHTRGASFLVGLQQAAPDASTTELVAALWDLVWSGHVTNDTFQPLRGLGQRAGRVRDRRMRAAGGRWSTVASLLGPPPSPEERAAARARVLLERYGVVSRNALAYEEVPGGFTAVYPVLRAMEDAGRVRRGHFVDGFQGAQFAVGGAVDRLRAQREDDHDTQILAAVDPAQPWGALLAWPPRALDTTPRRTSGARVVLVGGHPALYLGAGGSSLLVFQRALDEPERLDAAVAALQAEIDIKPLRFTRVDGFPPSDHPHRDALIRAGFTRDPGGLVLDRR